MDQDGYSQHGHGRILFNYAANFKKLASYVESLFLSFEAGNRQPPRVVIFILPLLLLFAYLVASLFTLKLLLL